MKKFDTRKLVFFLLLAAVIVATYFISPIAAIAQVVAFIVVLGYFVALDVRRRRGLSAYFNKATNVLSSVLRNSLLDLSIPTVVIDLKGTILWNNDEMSKLVGHRELYNKDVGDLITGFSVDSQSPAIFSAGQMVHVAGNDGSYRLRATRVSHGEKGKEVLVLYLIDETEKRQILDSYLNSRPVVAFLVLDNVEEIAQHHTSGYGGIATEIAKAEEIIKNWADGMDALLRKYDSGKYVCVFEQQDLEKLKLNRFEILDQIREIIADKTTLTMSVGVGCDGETFEQNQEFATTALDMALGRGGDQVAIKNKNNFEFYGGRSKTVEKRTKVKSRVLAEQLLDLVANADNIIVMGHKFADFDAVGAAVGIARVAKVCGKRVNIICNRNTSLAMPLVRKLEALPEYEGVFVDSARGLDLLRLNTLLVVVDAHSAGMLESSDICKNASRIIVIDHHRKMADYIEHTAMNYHEPYASSTCELISELVQYIDGEGTILKEEAEALLSGIVLDTKNFSFKIGARTFEVAAYLRRCGADTIEIKKIFQNDFESYLKRNELIQSAEFYREKIAISCREDAPFDDAKAVIAQAADELLSIEGAEASFVLYAIDGSTNISGRSLGEVNVQLILEKLGGGGHHMQAGAQVAADCETTRVMLCNAIDEYFEESGVHLN